MSNQRRAQPPLFTDGDEARRREAQKQKRLEREAASKAGAEIVRQLRERRAAKERGA